MRLFLSRLGPGLLYAGAAVGVSHLVQSTRAGASYGWVMVVVVILANLIKYPFFKAGPLYTAMHGKSLLEAIHAQGKWAMFLFYLITVSAMFVVQAVVTLLTASVLASVLGLSIPLWQISAFILLLCSLILLFGRFRLLNQTMKYVIILLTLTTVVTLLTAFFSFKGYSHPTTSFSFVRDTDVFFLIALIGWMPAPLDISLWHSEWALSAAKEKKEFNSRKVADFDFNVGYWGTTFLAAAFVGLGALLLRGSGTSLPSSGAAFVAEVVGMYTHTLGEWTFVFIAIAAFTTMFSTSLTVLDAYPRVLSKAVALSTTGKRNTYVPWLVLMLAGTLFVLIFQLENMKQLVDFATTISFLTAPILASLIVWIVRKGKVELFNRFEKGLIYLGLLFLYCFSIYYLWII
jgi:Mn2+/Fe2+ NRAMP family transporter